MKTATLILLILTTSGCRLLLPDPDLTCATDDDCSLTSRDLEGDPCCSACENSAVSKRWLKKVTSFCKHTNPGDYFDRCRHLSCIETPRQKAVCRKGMCVAVLDETDRH